MKTYSIWTGADDFLVCCDAEPTVDDRGNLVFRRADGLLVSICHIWTHFFIESES